MWPLLTFVVLLAWMMALAVATTSCHDMSIITVEGIFSLLITLCICIWVMETKGKK